MTSKLTEQLWLATSARLQGATDHGQHCSLKPRKGVDRTRVTRVTRGIGGIPLRVRFNVKAQPKIVKLFSSARHKESGDLTSTVTELLSLSAERHLAWDNSEASNPHGRGASNLYTSDGAAAPLILSPSFWVEKMVLASAACTFVFS